MTLDRRRTELARLPVAEQRAAFLELVNHNHVVTRLLDGLAEVNLPGWYLSAGALFQTVWNGLAERPATEGIRDYDVFYFDASDLSYEAEDETISRVAAHFSGLEATVEVRNEARVHLWYEAKFGVGAAPFTSTEDAIDHFPATTCCLGVRRMAEADVVYAPHGFGDLFAGVVRPNPVLAPREIYERKADRWQAQWPWLRVLPWPDPSA